MRISRLSRSLLTLCAILSIASIASEGSLLPISTASATPMEDLAKNLKPAEFSSRVERLLQEGHAADALELADLGLRDNTRNVRLRFARTVALERLGRSDEAASALRSMIAAYPEVPEPYNNLASIEAARGNYEEALDLLKQVLKINPDFALARKNLGDVYLAFALECYESAAPAFGENEKVQARLRALRRLTGHSANVTDAGKQFNE